MDAPLTSPTPAPAVSPSALPPANTPRAQAILELLIEASPAAFRANCKTAAAGGVGYVIYLGILALRPKLYPTLSDDLADVIAGGIALALPVAVAILQRNAWVRKVEQRFYHENAT